MHLICASFHLRVIVNYQEDFEQEIIHIYERWVTSIHTARNVYKQFRTSVGEVGKQLGEFSALYLESGWYIRKTQTK